MRREVTGAHWTFSFSVFIPLCLLCLPLSFRTGRRAPRREPEIVSQLRCGQTAGDGRTVSLQTEWQTVCALLCHCSVWPQAAMTASPALRLSWDCCAIYEESKGRNSAGGGGAQRLTDLQLTHGKKQIGLICEHAHTCAKGKYTKSSAAANWASQYSYSTLLKGNTHQTEFQQCTQAFFISNV